MQFACFLILTKKVKIDFAERDQPHDLVPMCQHKC